MGVLQSLGGADSRSGAIIPRQRRPASQNHQAHFPAASEPATVHQRPGTQRAAKPTGHHGEHESLLADADLATRISQKALFLLGIPAVIDVTAPELREQIG
ncbi:MULTISPECIES: hypothetical protein [unclassified Streptomyces]|uniref:hypothetical protein n=1 Tax=unclassified Streptomyces TaxID=2593676 RepID=UPI00114C8682|nr:MULTISPECIES: hypothetical protein [unclassified Streptomyces]MYS20213.1 hypothetical protein [Streptomyces sp. SID4948]